MIHLLKYLNISVLVGLITLLLLTGCNINQAAVAASTTPITSTATRIVTATPTQFTTVTPPPLPTATSTRVINYTPTARPSRTPTDTPAATEDPNSPASSQVEHVIIISIDGLRPDALALADTPALDALRAAGAYSPTAQAVLPSVTLVNHASMLGGMIPEKHGIAWNELDPSLGKIKGPTLFSVARQANLSTAMVVGKPKLDHLVLPGSVDDYTYAGFTDKQVVDVALQVIKNGLPNVLFIHLPDVDSAGHLTGWMSAGQLLAIGNTDSLVGDIVAALDTGNYLESTLLIITADHGGSGLSHGSNSPEDMTIPWLAVGPNVPAGLTIESNIVVFDTAATALYALNVPIPEEWDGRPVTEIFAKSK